MSVITVALGAWLATSIAVKGEGAQCPSVAQVSDALEARLPGVLLTDSPGDRDAFVLTLSPGPASVAHRVELAEATGRVRLRRTLPGVSATPERDCPALAESIALIVERHLQEVSYRDPSMLFTPAVVESVSGPSGPLGPRWDLFVGGSWQPGQEGLAAFEGRIGATRAMGWGRRLVLGASVGAEGGSRHVWAVEGGQGSGRLYRFPAELRLVGRFGQPAAIFEAGVFGGLHFLLLGSTAGPMTQSDRRLLPVTGLTGALRIPLGRRLFARVVASFGVALMKYEFATQSPVEKVQFGTEPTYGKMGIEAGYSFW